MSNKRNKPKNRISRQVGESIWGNEKCPTKNRPYPPGQHANKQSRVSEYGKQLREKQKLKGYYGNITEKQFVNYFKKALKLKGDTSENLLKILESRLDAIIYRLNLSPTVFGSRQLISHKHVLVNGKQVNIPSYQCKPSDEIEIKEKSRSASFILQPVQDAKRNIPEYLSFDEKKLKGTYVRLPTQDEIPFAVLMNPAAVVEYYSR